MTKLQSIRGMHDLIGEDYFSQKQIIKLFETIANNFNFKPIETPIMEFNEVFSRTLGLSSDVVMKEMYTFIDRSKDQLTLRPEGTAGIARAIISNGLTQNLPLKYFYYGPMFRYERPQKGRLRQFTQVGVEVYSKPGIEKDFEVIYLAANFLKNLKILDNLILKINNLGNLEDRNNYKKILKEYYLQHKSKLSKDSIIRLEKNPLRILDSKSAEDIEINKNVPNISDVLSEQSKKNFINLKNMLKDFNILYEDDPFLVRGLDYYSNTIFEFTLKNDTKFAILAGGNYDNLVAELGGPKLSGTGWAAGIERLASLVKFKNNKSKVILIIPMQSDFLTSAYKVREKFLHSNYATEVHIDKNLKKSLKYANKIEADYAIILGEEEVKKEVYTVKNLSTGLQNSIEKKFILEFFKND